MKYTDAQFERAALEILSTASDMREEELVQSVIEKLRQASVEHLSHGNRVFRALNPLRIELSRLDAALEVILVLNVKFLSTNPPTQLKRLIDLEYIDCVSRRNEKKPKIDRYYRITEDGQRRLLSYRI